MVWSKMKMREAPVLGGVSVLVREVGREENSRVLEQLLGLGVVLGLDLGVVDKVLFLAGVVVELEAVAVERVVGLVARDVGDGDLEGEGGSEVCLWAAAAC